jgi:hypothetical protein
MDWAWGKEAQFRSDVVPQVGLDVATGTVDLSVKKVVPRNGHLANIVCPFIQIPVYYLSSTLISFCFSHHYLALHKQCIVVSPQINARIYWFNRLYLNFNFEFAMIMPYSI